MRTPRGKRLVILGAGYAGVRTAVDLATRVHTIASRHGATGAEPVHVQLVSPVPHHRLVTQFHRVAAGTASQREVERPLHDLLARTGVEVVLGCAVEIDPEQELVRLEGGRALPYDRLVVALGSEMESFGVPGVEEHAFSIGRFEEATGVRHRIKELLQESGALGAERRAELLNWVIVGGGLTGIELAGELIDALPAEARRLRIDPAEIRLHLLEATPTLLPGMPAGTARRAHRQLVGKGIDVRVETAVQEVGEAGLSLQDGSSMRTGIVVWAGGVRGPRIVSESLPAHPRSRALVNEFLQSPDYPHVFAVGDCALAVPQGGERPVAPTAQNAVIQGRIAAHNVAASLFGEEMAPYVDASLGIVLSTGRHRGVAELNNVHLSGFPAYTLKRASEWRYHYELSQGVAAARKAFHTYQLRIGSSADRRRPDDDAVRRSA